MPDRAPGALRSLALVVGMLAMLTANSADAEPRQYDLPGDYADFLLHPETGDVVALEPTQNQVHVFRRASLEQSEPGERDAVPNSLATQSTIQAPDLTIDVGASPVAVCYKRFAGRAWFAVVCSRQPTLYLIDSETYELWRAVPLTGDGIGQVGASMNPKDPFVYYCFGKTNHTGVGVVDLREPTDRGRIIEWSRTFAVSADGRTFYHRGLNASDIESMALANDFQDPAPRFVRRHRHRHEATTFLQDPTGTYVTLGNKAFNAPLTQALGDLPFEPAAYSTDRPIVLGLSTRNLTPRSGFGLVVIRAASTNTLQRVGSELTAGLPRYATRALLPIEDPPMREQWIGRKPMLACDDARGQVVFAYRRQVLTWPIEDLGLADEPRLSFDFTGPQRLVAGQNYRLGFQLHDPDAELEFGPLPEGVLADAQGLSWQPTPADVGWTRVQVTLRNGAFTRTQAIDLEVEFPSTRLPFVAEGLAVDAAGKKAVVWAAVPNDEAPAPAAGAALCDVAVIDLASGAVASQQRLPVAGHEAVIAGNSVVFWQKKSGTVCAAYRLEDLSHHTDFVVAGQIIDCAPLGSHLVVRGLRSLEVFESEGFGRARLFGGDSAIPYEAPYNGRNGQYDEQVKPEGLYVSHLLLDEQLHLKLIVYSGRLQHMPVNAKGHPGLKPPPALAGDPAGVQLQVMLHGLVPQNEVAKRSVAPDRESAVALQRSYHQVQRGQIKINEYRLGLVYCTPDGHAKQALVHAHDPQAKRKDAFTAVVARPDRAVAVEDDTLYVWDYPPPDRAIRSSPPLAWNPRQSTLTLAEGETTVLEHEVTGGKAPLRFVLANDQAGLTLDELTGKLTIDNETILAEAAALIAEMNLGPAREKTPGAALADYAMENDPHALALLGKVPDGLAIALPIQIEAHDQELKPITILYHLVLDVPVDLALPTLNNRIDEVLALQQRQQEAWEAENRQNQHDLGRRVQELERQNTDLRFQLELLKARLQHQQPQPRGQEDAPNPGGGG